MPKSAEVKAPGQTSEKRSKRSQSRGKKEETATPTVDLRKILELPRPKKAGSAWTYFLKERRGQLEKPENQTTAEKFKQNCDLLKTAADEWKEIVEEE